ncbi:MAG: hypothetical protein Q8R25_02505 [bacterium]|nr:hypothetical protein [bacterium]
MEEVKKNPWAGGDDRDKKMKAENPIEFVRMRLENRIAPRVKEIESRTEEFKATSRARDAFGMARIVADHLRQDVDIEARQIKFCQMLLKRLDSTLRGHYMLDGAGRVQKIEDNKDGLPDLLDFLPYDKKREDPKAADVMRAGRAFEKIYPEVHFDFEHTAEMIEYTATIRVEKSDDMVS